MDEPRGKLKMKITNLAENAEDFTGNIWLLENNGSKALFDVGTGDSWNEIEELDKVDAVVITHSHYDHVDNLPKVMDKFSPKVYTFEPENIPVDAEELTEGDKIEVAGLNFQVFHTPGHKDDSICLYNEENGVLFTGDLIFPEGSFGRTDLEEGDRDQLIESIEKITELDVEEMYCGHDSAALEDVNSQIRKSLTEAKKKEAKY